MHHTSDSFFSGIPLFTSTPLKTSTVKRINYKKKYFAVRKQKKKMEKQMLYLLTAISSKVVKIERNTEEHIADIKKTVESLMLLIRANKVSSFQTDEQAAIHFRRCKFCSKKILKKDFNLHLKDFHKFVAQNAFTRKNLKN